MRSAHAALTAWIGLALASGLASADDDDTAAHALGSAIVYLGAAGDAQTRDMVDRRLSLRPRWLGRSLCETVSHICTFTTRPPPLDLRRRRRQHASKRRTRRKGMSASRVIPAFKARSTRLAPAKLPLFRSVVAHPPAPFASTSSNQQDQVSGTSFPALGPAASALARAATPISPSSR